MADTKASDTNVLLIPASVQSIILPDQNLSVSSFLQFSLPSASITTAPPLRKYFSTDCPPKDSSKSYLNYLRAQPLPRLSVLHQLLEGVQRARLGGSQSIVYAHANLNQSFPFWILTYWRQAHTLLDIQSKWRQAGAFLTKCQPSQDEEDTWLDEMLAGKPAEDSAFDIEADANLHAPIVTKALSDERMDSPVNGFGSAQDDSAEDDADLEGMDTEWSEVW
ncbi:uncharacterized protein F5147DRAFT_657050 [Suillus discolor]|uniref:Uncharacterized protein n=1 Tax=Suillus discolor TaxID=1912936 RepID=A0A9P7JL96_9AGAM|nr:uncharacterized protein F5147DRAFT_659509 [Suillus discolor]XP_041287658.1 uncharacterized protein F5147DRAFT_657050 [Suillus discolor]KAG2085474.1 hypothetical protein F5147DRAFT_659509 [Suillus discolor]KAG2094845.1 hypothetical protein F5147DRAFT_657050 [Suillus discolor]